MTAPPHVPDRFVPDEEQVLGEAPEPSLGPASALPRCDDCGGVLVGCESDETMTCHACGREEVTEAGRERRRQQRRESRLREAHNDGSFMPLSVSDWYDSRGGRL